MNSVTAIFNIYFCDYRTVTFKNLWNEIQGLSSTCPVFEYFFKYFQKFKHFQGLSRMRGNSVKCKNNFHGTTAKNVTVHSG